MKTSMLALTLALAAVACIATAQIATPPDLPPGEFAASGYSGAGQQPYISGVETYNGSFAYQEYPGGSQQAIYYDQEIPIPTYTGMYAQIVNITACGFSLPHYHPGIVEMNYVLEGAGLIAGLLLQTPETGTEPTWATGVSKGGVVTVTADSVHYAENPGCGTASLLQVFAGLAKGATTIPYIDLPGALLAQDATSVQFAYGLTDAQLQNAIRTVRPLFAVNETCLALCNGQAPSRSPTTAPTGR